MQTRLPAALLATPEGQEANRILRNCVHCGFCTATCPTYQLTGNELDGPRGRIYLIKQLLEGEVSDDRVQYHLDRCLTCRSCETTCPSGVEYGRLIDIGRHQVNQVVCRSTGPRLLRGLILQVMPHPQRFGLLLNLARWIKPLLPAVWRSKLPAEQKTGNWPPPRHARKVILLAGCAQASATPLTNAAAARVFDQLGISAIESPLAGCCGALAQHLDAGEAARAAARRNIDAWWPLVESGAEAIIGSASGCTLMLKEYAHLLAGDPVYADRAHQLQPLVRDLAEVLAEHDLSALARHRDAPLAVHVPCTLQHGQQKPDLLPDLLRRAGYTLTPVADSHLCCGSAGSYSLLQPELATQLRDNKLATLLQANPARVVTANIGCQLHLASGTQQPVQHWIELFDPAS